MKFITTAPDRRTLVKAIAAHTGMEPSYIGPPTFNYTVGTITIDREGYVDVPDEQAAPAKTARAVPAALRCGPKGGSNPWAVLAGGRGPLSCEFSQNSGVGVSPQKSKSAALFRTAVCIENGEG